MADPNPDPLVAIPDSPIVPVNLADMTPGTHGANANIGQEIRAILRYLPPYKLFLRKAGVPNINFTILVGYVHLTMDQAHLLTVPGDTDLISESVILFLETAIPADWIEIETNVAGNAPLAGLRRVLEVALIENNAQDRALQGFVANFWTPAPAAGRPAGHDPTEAALDAFFAGGVLANPFDPHAFLTAWGSRVLEIDRNRIQGKLFCLMAQGVIAFSTGGNVTPGKLERIAGSLQDAHRVTLVASEEDISEIFSRLDKALHARKEDYDEIFSSLASLYTIEYSVRMHNIVAQAKGTGVSGPGIIAQAIKARPQSAIWGFLLHHCPAEMSAFRTAIRTVANNPLVGFGSHADTELVKNSRYSTVLYAALKVLKELCSSKSVRGYKGPKTCSLSVEIDGIIDNEKDVAEVDFGQFSGDGEFAIDWATFLEDKEYLINATDA